jgi:Leucine-rich repeat (LRR) protein
MEPVNAADMVCQNCRRNQADYKNLAHQLKPGTKLAGKYVTGSVIGEGGFGITYVGRDLFLDISVAIKEYYPAGHVSRHTESTAEVALTYGSQEAQFEEGKQKFLSEARILARLDNAPGIVHVRDFFQENNTAYIVMEHLNGITLEKYLSSVGKIPVSKVLPLMYPIMDALDQVHRKGLVHRDISPSNIMLTGQWDIKLLDFGAARPFNTDDDKSLSIMLKHGYAPEEQYRSRGAQGPWTDVYGLCATIYKCITGVAPEDSLQRTYFDDTKRPSERGIEISSEIEAVLMRGMSVYQQDRYQSMKELKDAFQSASISLSSPEYRRAPAGPAVAMPENAVPEDGEVTQYISASASSKTPEPPQNPHSPAVQPKDIAVHSPSAPPKEKAALPVKESAQPKAEKPYPAKEKATGQKQPSGKPKKHRLRKVLAYIAAAIVLIGIVVTIYNMVFFTTIGNERFPKNATSIYVYATKIPRAHLERLSSFTHLQSLGLIECMLTDEDVSVIVQETQNIPELTSVDLSENREITNLGTLTELTGLQHLKISGTSISDLSSIASFESLQTLYAAGNGIEDISALAGLKELFILELNNNAISDISTLAELEKLDNLDMSNNSISDISALANCPELDDVNLAYNAISDISALSDSTLLMSLDLSHNSIVDISAIKGNFDMSRLNLSHNLITDISPLYNMQKMMSLNLSGNSISDASVLSRMENLISLVISKNQITNISGVSGMSKLSELDISKNKIRDISPLRELPQGLYLKLHNNQIEDISPIVGLVDKVIDIHNNNISDVSSLADCGQLISVILIGNPVTDISQLKSINADKIIIDYNENADYSLLADSPDKTFIIYNVPREKEYDVSAAAGEKATVISDVWIDPNEETEQEDG